MKIKTNHIVLTTIYLPHVLYALSENLREFGHLDSTLCWVIGDKKTPPDCHKMCNDVTNLGLEIRYLDIDDQEKWGKYFPDFYSMLPYNNESRRNIGYLLALEHGCDRLISIDDDNFPTAMDFVGGHMACAKEWNDKVVHEPSGFHNICMYLDIEPSRIIFPRGFPFKLRDIRNEQVQIDPNEHSLIGVVQGLWLKEPDIDAITWLNGTVQSRGYNGPDHVVLDQKTWSPINTQNTSIIRELIPAYFCVPMCFPVPGGKIERYGDILGGYFLQAILENTPYLVAFGYPIVEHRRNYHNYMNDLRCEYWGMMLTDWLTNELKNNFHPKDSKILDRVVNLSEFLNECHKNLPSWCPKELHDFMIKTSNSLLLWASVCQKIL